MHLSLPFNVISTLHSLRTEGWKPSGHSVVQAPNLPDCLTLPRCFHLALLSSLPHIFSSEGWHKDLIDLLCSGFVHESPSVTKRSNSFSSWFPILSNISELFLSALAFFYKALARYFFSPFNFLFGLSYFLSFPHWLAYSSVMSQPIHTLFFFFNEWLSKLTKIGSSWNNTVFAGLKLS